MAVVLVVDGTRNMIGLPFFLLFLSLFESSSLETLPQDGGADNGSRLGTMDRNQSEKSTDKSIFKALFTSRRLLSLIITLSNAVIYFMIWSTLPSGP